PIARRYPGGTVVREPRPVLGVVFARRFPVRADDRVVLVDAADQRAEIHARVVDLQGGDVGLRAQVADLVDGVPARLVVIIAAGPDGVGRGSYEPVAVRVDGA